MERAPQSLRKTHWLSEIVTDGVPAGAFALVRVNRLPEPVGVSRQDLNVALYRALQNTKIGNRNAGSTLIGGLIGLAVVDAVVVRNVVVNVESRVPDPDQTAISPNARMTGLAVVHAEVLAQRVVVPALAAD